MLKEALYRTGDCLYKGWDQSYIASKIDSMCNHTDKVLGTVLHKHWKYKNG